MMPLKDQAVIAGIGQTAFARQLEQSETELAIEAISIALEDAGIAPAEVNGLCSYSIETTPQDMIARNLGMGDITFFALSTPGGGGGCATVGLGALAIATGQADVVVAWRSRKRGRKSSRPWASTKMLVEGLDQWSRPFGLVRPVDEIGLLGRRFMYDHGISRDALANIALAQRKHANRNPLAVMHSKPLDRETYHAARMISDPLGLYDCCLETDGAVAVVLVSAERARDLRQKPAYIHAFGQGITQGSLTMANYFATLPLRGQAHASAASLWRYSDFKPADVAAAQIYDAFTPEVLFTLAAYGFCEADGLEEFSANGGLEYTGHFPVNTAGGGLSEAYIHGFNLISEGVRQVRGTSTSQVEGPGCVFVSSSDCVPTGALLLRG